MTHEYYDQRTDPTHYRIMMALYQAVVMQETKKSWEVLNRFCDSSFRVFVSRISLAEHEVY